MTEHDNPPEPYAWMAVGGTIWRHKSSEDDVPLYAAPQPAVEPAQTLIAKLQADPGYAWSWHCNIAMAYVDAGGDHYTGNQGAARFMKLFANVDPAHELQAPQPQQPAVAWRLKDAEATEHYGKSIYVYYDSADLRTDHPDTKKVTTMMEPLFTSPPPPAEVPLLTYEDIDAVLGFTDHTVASTRMTLRAVARAIEQLVRQKAGLA